MNASENQSAGGSPGRTGKCPHGRFFLSYARQDDEPFVARLHEDLTARGCELWWDRRCMPNRGLAFLREIRDAITESERLLLVFGPRAADSDYVRAEWQYACSIGVPVMLLLRLGEYSQLPETLKHLDAIDFRKDDAYGTGLATLRRQLEQPTSPLGRLVGVPDLPAQYQARPADLNSIREILVLDSHAPVVLTEAGRRAGLQGMGGVGKSVLAAAIGRDFEIRRAFPDGIFWVPLGPRAPVKSRLADVCRFFGEAQQSFEDVEQGRARLAELLAQRAALVVLDDAVELEHARAFESIGTRCALLITTRDARLLSELGATMRRVDVLGADEAKRFIAGWLIDPQSVVSKDEQERLRQIEQTASSLSREAEFVSRECGHLPLALALCAAQVRAGVSWTSLLEALREADLRYLDHPNGSVFRSIQVSIEALEREDARYPRHYLELAVFAPGEPIPENALMTLWQRKGALSVRIVDKLLATLAGRALVRLSGQAPNRLIQLHDLQHDYARDSVGDLAAVHLILLEAYQQKFSGGWHSGPDDGYFFQHLAIHLAGAHRADELCGLLTTAPAWMNASFAACNDDSQFSQDLELALKSPGGQRSPVRVALRTAQHLVRERVSAYSDDDLETLVLLNRTSEALSHARLRPAVSARIRGLVRVHRVSPENKRSGGDLLAEAAALAHVVPPGESWRSTALDLLALALFEAERPVEALEVLRYSPQTGRPRYTSDEETLVSSLEKKRRFRDAAAVARTIENQADRARELLLLAASAGEAGSLEFREALIDEAISDARQAAGRGVELLHTAEALQTAAEMIEGDVVKSRGLYVEALNCICRHEGYRERELENVATVLAKLGETELVLSAVSASNYPEHFKRDRLSALSVAAAAAGKLDTALAVARPIGDAATLAQTLVQLVPALQKAGDARLGAVIAETLSTIEQIDPASNCGRRSPYGSIRSQTLCFVAETLASINWQRAMELLQRALEDVRADDNPAEAVAAVGRSMLQLGLREQGEALLDEGMALASSDGTFLDLATILAEAGDEERALCAGLQSGERYSVSALEHIAEVFARNGRSDAACRAVAAISDGDSRASASWKVGPKLAMHAPYAARMLFDEAMGNHNWPLGFVLSGVGEAHQCWTPELLEQALALVEIVKDQQRQVEALKSLLKGVLTRGWSEKVPSLLEIARRLGRLPALSQEVVKAAETALKQQDLDLALLLAETVSGTEDGSLLVYQVGLALARAGDVRALTIAKTLRGYRGAQILEAVALARARAGDATAGDILNEKLAAMRSTQPVPEDRQLHDMTGALAECGELNRALKAVSVIADERTRVNALASIAATLAANSLLAESLNVIDLIVEPVARARARLLLADAAGSSQLRPAAIAEAAVSDSTPAALVADWVSALCDSAVKHSRDAPLVTLLLNAARRVCDNLSLERGRAQCRATISRALARMARFDDALEMARSVEDSVGNDYGTLRGETMGFVADELARAGNADRTRAAATEADRISTEALFVLLSMAPMMPPEGFDSVHRCRVEKLLAEAGRPVVEVEPSAAVTPVQTDADSLGRFLILLAASISTSEKPCSEKSRAEIVEAIRVAGWISPKWQEVFGCSGTLDL